MSSFITDKFLLKSSYAEELYHSYAKDLPIIDFHNHLPPNEIAKNKQFKNLTKIWLDGDHYKWRAMRSLGVEEKYITGKASDEEKFKKWAFTVPYTMRNPLYHWSHLELKRYFNIDEQINEKTALSIYNQCNDLLKTPQYTTQGLLKMANAEVVCTTDDPIDNLKNHQDIAKSKFNVQTLPTFRPDNIINIEGVEFNTYVDSLSCVSGIKIKNLESFLEAIESRVQYFHDNGCRLSDHGLSYVYSEKFTDKKVDSIIKDRFNDKALSDKEISIYKSAILFYLGQFYANKGWTMQLHLGPIRDTNKLLLREIGINVGVDSIGDYQHAESLAYYLNKLNDDGSLPKTIIYNSNPSDNDLFATMAGNFSEGGTKSKVQFGTAWWFLDQKDGITKQINSLSNMGLLSCSVGMLTDSRSFLSFTRHEYYRRILCNIFGEDIKNGELPNDIPWIGKIISDICYHNAKSYFNFQGLKSKTSKPQIVIDK
ncbi:glucuronate isomerase [Flaviramulus sp. BrNp1-15]|uniref:glucuronate isomerase n=1 Tax=Flaviramulus sp. BrNp1-15 TaxID=2916754 RepID=UPI001EE9873D|nr:glucuronate isomerase [Flaviramulus sp. BrNp1-15]ULC60709.1 glucuronate isomerase [Flaviramulus sp. BrNp1-15]